MNETGKTDQKVSLLFAGLITIGILGSFAVAAFAIHQDFQGRIGFRLKDWVQVDFEGRHDPNPADKATDP